MSMHPRQSEEDYRVHLGQSVAREAELAFRSLDIPGLLSMPGCFRVEVLEVYSKNRTIAIAVGVLVDDRDRETLEAVPAARASKVEPSAE
jgi:hypothetical protein